MGRIKRSALVKPNEKALFASPVADQLYFSGNARHFFAGR